MLYLPAEMHQRRFAVPVLLLVAVLLCAGLLAPRAVNGHEVPARVAVTGFVHAEGDVLLLALRVPLAAMRDIDFPMDDDGMLDLVAVRPLLPEAAQLWVACYLRAWENGAPLPSPRVAATRLSLPSDRSFSAYESALSHFGAPFLDPWVRLPWQQALLDVLLEIPVHDATARFALEPALGHLGQRTVSSLTLVLADGATRAFVFEGNPGRIELDPSAWRGVARVVGEGFRHLLGGFDHLLFVLCLVLPVRRLRPLVLLVTSFTVAHSLTLAAAALGLVPSALWFPALVETLIALSIVILAVENIVLSEERLARRWRVAFLFGLVHGFGFSFALGEQLQFAGAHLVTALAAFNVGVELGQVLVLVAALPVLALARRWVGDVRAPLVTVVGSAFIAHTAWHWMHARSVDLLAYREGFVAPALDATFALGVLRVGLLLAVALAVALGMQHIFKTYSRS
jgi:hypothetical protein